MRWIRIPFIALTLVAASCGSDSSPFASVTSTTAQNAIAPSTSTPPPTSSSTTTQESSPTSSSTTTSTQAATTGVAEAATALSTGWSATTLQDQGTGGPTLFADNGSTRVVIGKSFSGCCFGTVGLWLSSGGGAWTEIPNSNEMLGFPETADAMSLLGTGPRDLDVIDGRFVAAGGFDLESFDPAGRFTTPVIWQSPDGENWTSTELPAAAGLVTSLVGTPSGMLAVVDDFDTTATLWHSQDGVEWTEVSDVDLTSLADNLMIDRIGKRLVIHDDIGIAVRVSDDLGRTWAPPDGPITAGTVAPSGDGGVMLRDGFLARSVDGFEWEPVGAGELMPLSPWSAAAVITSIPTIQVGPLTVVVAGADLWVAGASTPWSKADNDAVFEPVAEGPLWIRSLTIEDDGTIVAIGTIPIPFTGNKPLNDYMIWTHPPVDANP